ncbi:DUF6855 family protein [Propioniciclava sp. MC1595]
MTAHHSGGHVELHHALSPLLEELGLVELEHKPRGNRVRAVQP